MRVPKDADREFDNILFMSLPYKSYWLAEPPQNPGRFSSLFAYLPWHEKLRRGWEGELHLHSKK